MDNSVSKMKQPSPSVSSGTVENINENGKKYKVIQPAKTGVLKPPKITTTPIRDWVEIKRKENPHTIYKIHTNDYKIKTFNTIASLGIIACGFISVIKLFKK